MKGVILVGDNDEGPDAAIRSLKRQIRDSRIVQYAPDAALQVVPVSDQSSLRLAMLTLPLASDRSALRGALETVLLQCMSAELAAYAPCADPFVECAKPDGGDQSHLDKMRMRILLAAAYPQEPNITLSKAMKAKRNLFDYHHPCHNVIVEAVQALLAQMMR